MKISARYVVAILAGAGLYFASYPVAVRVLMGTDASRPRQGGCSMIPEGFLVRPPQWVGHVMTVYRPVEWVAARAPFEGPMRLWHQVWGVDEETRGRLLSRCLDLDPDTKY
jgi:hypothetical protein